MKIRIAGIDPALNNLGISFAEYDTTTGAVEYTGITLVQTDSLAGKTVRKNSDDLRRANQLRQGLIEACKQADILFVEVPTGTQSSRGAISNGICIGILAGLPKPIIEVSYSETKLASVGIKTATKDEMIAWAMKTAPDLPWKMRKTKLGLVPIKDNEHCADACAIIKAGIMTPEFKVAVAMAPKA